MKMNNNNNNNNNINKSELRLGSEQKKSTILSKVPYLRWTSPLASDFVISRTPSPGLLESINIVSEWDGCNGPLESLLLLLLLLLLFPLPPLCCGWRDDEGWKWFSEDTWFALVDSRLFLSRNDIRGKKKKKIGLFCFLLI